MLYLEIETIYPVSNFIHFKRSKKGSLTDEIFLLIKAV